MTAAGPLAIPARFQERAGPGDMPLTEYWDANNECRHGWLPHERCRACAAGEVPDLMGSFRRSSERFYVRRIRDDGRVGYTGPLRGRSRADREAQAWRDASGQHTWTAEVVPVDEQSKREVRDWRKEVKARRAAQAA